MSINATDIGHITSDDIAVAWEIAKPKNGSVSLPANLLKDCSDERLPEVLVNMPTQILLGLVRSRTKRDRRVLSALACLPVTSHTAVTPEFEAFLASRVARNSNTPADTLIQLSFHHATIVRVELAKNSQLPPLAMARLVDDPEMKVRKTIADKKVVPLFFLKKLVNDKYAGVRGAALLNPNASEQLILDNVDRASIGAQRQLIWERTTSTAVLLKLLDKKHDLWTYRSFLYHPNTDRAVLKKLYAKVLKENTSHRPVVKTSLLEKIGQKLSQS